MEKKRKRGKKKICLFKNAIQMIYQIRYIEKRGKRRKKEKKGGKKPIFTFKKSKFLIFGMPDIRLFPSTDHHSCKQDSPLHIQVLFVGLHWILNFRISAQFFWPDTGYSAGQLSYNFLSINLQYKQNLLTFLIAISLLFSTYQKQNSFSGQILDNK